MKEILLFILGIAVTLISAWGKSWIDRVSYCSNEIYRQRISCLNQIWSSFYEVKEIYSSKISSSHNNWVVNNKKEATGKLNKFRRTIDESQIILTNEIINQFREIDTYFFTLLDTEINPSQYSKDINSMLEKLSRSINENMNKRLHTVDLKLRT